MISALAQTSLPLQSVLVPPSSFSVLGQNASFRPSSSTPFNPTNATPPFFQIFDESFISLLPGQKSFIKQIAFNDTFVFASEAPIFNPGTNELFFTSSLVAPESTLTHNNRVSKINVGDVEEALTKGEVNINVPFTTLDLPDTVQITNGGTGPFKGNLLLATRGRGLLPSSVVLVNPKPPYNATVLLDNFFGRQFNSMNDIKVHESGQIVFTDPGVGQIQGEKPAPGLPNQVYALDPATGFVRVVADQLVLPNGVAFADNGRTAYIGDSGSGVFGASDPATIYAYDVDPVSLAFKNKRVFAFVDSGIPDGIQVDTQGRVYSGTADGIQVWNSNGILIGKIFVGSTVANMAFTGKGLLLILAGNSIFAASINAEPNLVVS
ncbi:hypothetical protein BDQ17DRAFT_369019 [Cyathus striatus]|nr:hypothetical protein BDQ17DRAFT_369019 [Cyathus striatus]